MSKRQNQKVYSRGRPAKRVLKLDATPEEVARRRGRPRRKRFHRLPIPVNRKRKNRPSP